MKIMKHLFVLILVSVAGFAPALYAANPLLLLPGESAAVSCTSCPPAPVVEVPVVVPMPGNAHAVSHPAQVQALGYAKCQECHAPTSTTPAKVGASGTFLCSQYDFCTASPGIAGPSTCKIGVTFPHPVTGALVSDPISKAPVTSGKTVGGYAPGSTPFCRDCHYPHATAGYKEPPKNQIHAGCLDCHAALGSSKLKPGIKD